MALVSLPENYGSSCFKATNIMNISRKEKIEAVRKVCSDLAVFQVYLSKHKICLKDVNYNAFKDTEVSVTGAVGGHCMVHGCGSCICSKHE